MSGNTINECRSLLALIIARGRADVEFMADRPRDFDEGEIPDVLRVSQI
jgi:hypothetical protein